PASCRRRGRARDRHARACLRDTRCAAPRAASSRPGAARAGVAGRAGRDLFHAGETGDTMSQGNDATPPRVGGGAHGYRFDTYVAAMTRQMLEGLLARRDGIPQPVRKLHWTGYQGYNQLTGLAINGQEWPDDFGIETSIPANCDWPEDDKVMLQFLRVHGERIDGGSDSDSDEDDDDDGRDEDEDEVEVEVEEYEEIENFEWGDRF